MVKGTSGVNQWGPLQAPRAWSAPRRGFFNQRRLAGGETGLLSGHSESEDRACSFHSSWAQRTNSFLRASWTCRCCNGFPPAFPGTDIPHLVSAKTVNPKQSRTISEWFYMGFLCLLAVWPWASYWGSLCLNFFFSDIGIIMELISEGGNEDLEWDPAYNEPSTYVCCYCLQLP